MSVKKNNNNKQLADEFTLSDSFPIPTYEDWKIAAEKLLRGQSFDKKLITKTYEGINLKPIYTREDINGLSFINSIPGKDNFLRGTKPDGFLSEAWNICQTINADSLEEFNSNLRYALKRGQTAIHIDIKLLNINDVNDMAIILNEIDITKFAIYIRDDYSPLKAVNLLLDYATKKSINTKNIRGGIIASPIEYLSEKGALQSDIESIYDDMAQTMQLATEHFEEFRVLTIRGDVFHNAGANSITELAVSLSIAVEYIQAMIKRDIKINEVAKHISLSTGIGSNFFMEIAKLRALRVLFKNIIEAFGGEGDALKAHIHANTSIFNKTKLDPFVNTLRTTTETFSAILGSADTITTAPYDTLEKDNDKLSTRIARNIQIILKEESNLKRLIDPAGGSYYIETLTKNIMEQSWKEFQNIEENEGILECLKSNYIQSVIDDTVALRKKDLFKRKSVIVGTNMFVNLEDKISNNDKDENISDKNLPLTIKKLNFARLAEPFEDIRKSVSVYEEKTGKRPSIYLANFGAVKQYKGRADFSRGYFDVGGFDIIYPKGINNIEELITNTVRSQSNIIIICSDDKSYPELIANFTPALKEQMPNVFVILAGFPGDNEATYRANGVDDFIYMGSNIFNTLETLLKKAGVR